MIGIGLTNFWSQCSSIQLSETPVWIYCVWVVGSGWISTPCFLHMRRQKGGWVGFKIQGLCICLSPSCTGGGFLLFFLQFFFYLSIPAIITCYGKKNKLEMETPKLQKACQTLLKGSFTLLRWFSTHINIVVYCKSVIEALFSHLCVTAYGVQGHVISSLLVKMVHYALKKSKRKCNHHSLLTIQSKRLQIVFVL